MILASSPSSDSRVTTLSQTVPHLQLITISPHAEKRGQRRNMSGIARDNRLQRMEVVSIPEHHDDEVDPSPHSDASAHADRMSDATGCPSKPEQ